MKALTTELGYDVSGPDSQGELELYKQWWEDGDLLEDCAYVTHADLVAMLALYDEAAEQDDNGPLVTLTTIEGPNIVKEFLEDGE